MGGSGGSGGPGDADGVVGAVDDAASLELHPVSPHLDEHGGETRVGDESAVGGEVAQEDLQLLVPISSEAVAPSPYRQEAVLPP
mmetsp:Transcript_33355/g.83085  ORF Transcript_33355/g.83085 Transcript_33355/m.83085 type:complete len:84 (-) Transcript_33355:363-614(-)